MKPLLTLITLAIATTSNASPHQHQKTSSWTTLPSIPLFPRQEHTTIYLPTTDSIYIIGGMVPDNASYPIPTTPLVQRYALSSSTWYDVSPIPTAMNHINAAVVDGKIYVLGGMVPSPETPIVLWDAAPDSFVYDPVSDSWQRLPDMPDYRGASITAVRENVIYLAGGLKSLGDEQDTVDTTTSYDTTTGLWSTLPPLPAPRDHAAGSVVGDTYFVLGGRSFGQFNCNDTVFALDLLDVAKGWTTKNGRMPTPRGGISAGVVGEKFYVFGGEGNRDEGSDGVFNQTEVYDVVSDFWESLGPMDIPRHGTSAVGVNGSIYIPGGGTKIGGDGPVDFFSVFEP
ncbi:hypothetical protein HYFRA_00009802 [Hymenoscyphus fraxineus]|uniref:Galactose oxidase n=1 Tax=Hymenoscyphus fraxineus TaxID=746836 RepID=A0A9N9L5G2_9HELO|nr:hypothetical protein HYFRA_00009802 [Hymenoscyphus fraxineus]